MSEPLDLSQLVKRDYARFFLADNPFPVLAVAEENPRIMVDREQVLNLIKDTISNCYLSGKSQAMVIQGNYGSGKSHILKYVKSQINTQLGSQGEKKTIAVYVESPLDSFQDMYVEIMRNLGDGFIKKLACDIVTDYIIGKPDSLDGLIIEKKREDELRKYIIDELKRNPLNFYDIARKGMVRLLDLFRGIGKLYEQDLRIFDYAYVFLRMADPVASSVSWRWLTGESLLKAERDILQVTASLEEERGLDAFHDLKLLLKAGGYSMIFILLDELEKITELHFSIRTRYLDDLRHFIDSNIDGICLIACVTPAGFSELEASGHPLYRRLLAVNQTLRPFDTELTEKLIRAYMVVAREAYINKKGMSKEQVENEISKRGGDYGIFPFDAKAVRKIRDAAQGNVGDILTSCRRLIDDAYDNNVGLIDDEFVDSVIESPQAEEV